MHTVTNSGRKYASYNAPSKVGGRVIDLTEPYQYCETCDDIKYHIHKEETSGHKELTGCL